MSEEANLSCILRLCLVPGFLPHDVSYGGGGFLAASCQSACPGRFAVQSATTTRKEQFHVREKQQKHLRSLARTMKPVNFFLNYAARVITTVAVIGLRHCQGIRIAVCRRGGRPLARESCTWVLPRCRLSKRTYELEMKMSI